MPTVAHTHTHTPPRVIVANKGYLKEMSAIVLDVQQTAPDTWHSYLAWVLTRQYTHNLDSHFAAARFDYVKAVYGVTEETPRWKRCLSSVKVRAALNHLYLLYDLLIRMGLLQPPVY